MFVLYYIVDKKDFANSVTDMQVQWLLLVDGTWLQKKKIKHRPSGHCTYSLKDQKSKI